MRNELIIGGYSIDTIENLDINITKEVYNIDDPSKRQSDFSKSIDIPGSKANDFVFKSLFDVSFSIRNSDQLNPDFNPSKKATCIYYQDTLQQISGYCQLNEIKILNNDQVTYSITIYGKNIDIFSKLSDRTLNDLTTLGTATWNDTEIINSWTAVYDPTIKLTYPMLDRGLSRYGRNGDASSNLSYNYNAFKPFIYVKHLVNAIFQEAGVSLEVATFFETDQFKKLILECDVKNFRQDQTSIDNSLVEATRSTNQTLSIVSTANSGDLSLIYANVFQYNITSIDPLSQYNATTGTFTKLNSGYTNFEVEAYINVVNTTGPLGRLYIYAIRKRGSSYRVIGNQYVKILPGSSTTHNFKISVDSEELLAGDEVRFCIGNFYLNLTGGVIDNSTITGITFISTSPNSYKQYEDGQINYGQTFPIAGLLPYMKQTDFIMGIIKMFNLYISPIYETGVIVEPRDTYYISDTIDWTELLDTSQDFSIKPQGLLENKQLQFQYADNGDDLNKIFKQSTSFNYGYLDLIFDNEFVKETKKVEIPFSLIPLQADKDKNIFMRTIFDGMSQEKSPKPIIAYFGGMKSGRLRYWNYNNTIATDYTTYPFAGHIDDLVAPNYDLAFDVQDFYFYTTPGTSGVTTTDNNLYNQFHKSQWEQIGNKDSKLIEAYFKLRPNDIANLDFRKTYWIKDNAYRLLSVQDYNPNGDTTTLCKLLKFAYQATFVPTVVTANGGNGQGEKDGGYNTTQNVIKSGILATGGNVINDNTNGIVVTGNGNNLGGDNSNILIQGDDNIILPGIIDVVLINTSGLTIAESGVQYIDNIKVDFGTPVNGYNLSYNSATNSVKFTAPGGGGGGDMYKSVYDIDDDGIVDNAETINVIVRNSTGATLHRGKIVYLSGSTGNRPNAILAQANSEATSSGTFGVVMDDIANNSDGNVCALGTLHDLDTRNTAPNPFTSLVLVDGDTLWLDYATAGYVTNVKPSAPYHAVRIGTVARTSPTNGRIVYSIINGFELNELHNVSLSSEANNDVLSYESATSLWKNRALTTATIPDSTNKRYVTDANLTVIENTSNTNTGDETNATIKSKLSMTTAGALLVTKIAPVPLYNQSLAQQGAGFATDTYLTGSSIAIPNGSLQAGSRYRCIFNVTKTGAGTATPIINVRIGTAGTTADTSRGTLTHSAQTAVIDEGTFEVFVTFRSVGSGTSAVIQSLSRLSHRLSVTGLGTGVGEPELATSAGFNSTTSGLIIGLSVNGGTSASWTVNLVQAELNNLI